MIFECNGLIGDSFFYFQYLECHVFVALFCMLMQCIPALGTSENPYVSGCQYLAELRTFWQNYSQMIIMCIWQK